MSSDVFYTSCDFFSHFKIIYASIRQNINEEIVQLACGIFVLGENGAVQETTQVLVYSQKIDPGFATKMHRKMTLILNKTRCFY